MNEKPETNYRAWLAKAEEDLLNIQNNLGADRVPWGTVCFHAQQAGEKVLKAFLVYHRMKPKKTHDLVILLTACTDIAPELDDLEQDCENLSFYAVDTRYPGLHAPGEEEGRALTDAAHRIRRRVLELLPDAD
jgi:HEPN domain-containing protein